MSGYFTTQSSRPMFTIRHAQTGQSLPIDPMSINSAEDFSSHITKETSIPSTAQICMTSKGRQFKFVNIHSEREIYLWDRRLISSNTKDVSPEPVPTLSDLGLDFRDELPGEGTSLDAWQVNLKKRRDWAIKVNDAITAWNAQAGMLEEQLRNISSGSHAARENLSTHVKSLQGKHTQLQTWGGQILEEMNSLDEHWAEALQDVALLQARKGLGEYLSAGAPSGTSALLDSNSEGEMCSLLEFVDQGETKASGRKILGLASEFNNELQSLGKDVEGINSRYATIRSSQEHGPSLKSGISSSAISSLYAEVEPIIRKISNDYEAVLTIQNTPKTLSSLAKTADHHVKHFVPELKKLLHEVRGIILALIEHKSELKAYAQSQMKQIAEMQSSLAGVQSAVTTFNLRDEAVAAMESLDFLLRLPVLIGSLMIEFVRRSEWASKIREDSATLAEEIAVYQDEEDKRRKKWMNQLGSFLNAEKLQVSFLRIEVDVKTREPTWLNLTREDVDMFISKVARYPVFANDVAELDVARKALDGPTKLQVKRASAFKDGSFHEAAQYGKTSLLLRGDNDTIRALQADNTRLQERLKGSDSRIRRLEDILHRQSQLVSRPSQETLVSASSASRAPPSPHLRNVIPVTEKTSRSPSFNNSSSPRMVAHDRIIHENKALQERVLKLETDLASEKARNLVLEDSKENHAATQADFQRRINEVTATKADLMSNLDAQKLEYEADRQLLRDENRKLKFRVEEVEEELDRLVGSYDASTAKGGSADIVVAELQSELDRVKREMAEEVQKAQGQMEFLKNDYTMQRERANQLEGQVEAWREEKAELEKKQSSIDQAQTTSQEQHKRIVKEMHTTLGGEYIATNDLTSMLEAVERLAIRASSQRKEMQTTMDELKTRTLTAERREEEQSEQLRFLQTQVGDADTAFDTLRENLADQKARYEALEAELETEKLDAQKLRDESVTAEEKLARLASRLHDEKGRREELSNLYDNARFGNHLIEGDLNRATHQLEIARLEATNMSARLNAQSARVETISRLLWEYAQKMRSVLEQTGFAIVEVDGANTIQRASKRESLGPGQSMEQSSLTLLPNAAPEMPSPGSSPSENTKWSSAETDALRESRYKSLIDEANFIPLDALAETLVRRLKDTEHIARKWQREAKSVREKFRYAQLEAANKIAFRNFKDGDLALFLPTRNQASKRSWAAFNVGAPHYFLRENEGHSLKSREFLLARISRVEERVVDLGRSTSSSLIAMDRSPVRTRPGSSGANGQDDALSIEDENPFNLSDGLKWYYLDANEETLRAPSTPGLGTSTVASAKVDAEAKKSVFTPSRAAGIISGTSPTSTAGAAARTLSRNLDTHSRRGSSASKRSSIAIPIPGLSRKDKDASSIVAGSPASAQSHGHQRNGSTGLTVKGQASSPTVSPRLGVILDDANANAGSNSENDVWRGEGQDKNLHVHPDEHFGASSPDANHSKPSSFSRKWHSLWSLDVGVGVGNGESSSAKSQHSDSGPPIPPKRPLSPR